MQQSSDTTAVQIVLTFTSTATTITATMPANATIAPPGFYMLFLVRRLAPATVLQFSLCDAKLHCGPASNVDVYDLHAPTC